MGKSVWGGFFGGGGGTDSSTSSNAGGGVVHHSETNGSYGSDWFKKYEISIIDYKSIIITLYNQLIL